MQNAVFKTFPDAHSEYKFTNRAPDILFSRKCYEWVQEQVQGEIISLYVVVQGSDPSRSAVQSSPFG